jgi:hypothetical protein
MEAEGRGHGVLSAFRSYGSGGVPAAHGRSSIRSSFVAKPSKLGNFWPYDRTRGRTIFKSAEPASPNGEGVVEGNAV